VASKVIVQAYFEMNFFKTAGTLEAEISVSGKTQCLPAVSGDKKRKPFGMTFSFKFHYDIYMQVFKAEVQVTCEKMLCKI